MRCQRNLSKTNKIKKTQKKLSEVDIANLPEKGFKVIIVKMVKEFRRIMDEHREKLEVFSKELESVKHNQTEMKNTKTKMKNTLGETKKILE